MPVPKSEKSLAGRAAAHQSWANTTNRSARTAPARAGLDAKFLAEAGGDPIRADSLRKAHFAALALKSARSRRRAAEARAVATNLDRQAADADAMLNTTGTTP
jgi:hypothetical protein